MTFASILLQKAQIDSLWEKPSKNILWLLFRTKNASKFYFVADFEKKNFLLSDASCDADGDAPSAAMSFLLF